VPLRRCVFKLDFKSSSESVCKAQAEVSYRCV